MQILNMYSLRLIRTDCNNITTIMYSVKKKKNLTIGFDDFANSQNQRVHTPGELVASLLFTRLC